MPHSLQITRDHHTPYRHILVWRQRTLDVRSRKLEFHPLGLLYPLQRFWVVISTFIDRWVDALFGERLEYTVMDDRTMGLSADGEIGPLEAPPEEVAIYLEETVLR